MSILIWIVISSILGVGMTYLQVYLSKKESKWLGLILPVITIIITVFLAFKTVLFIDVHISEIMYPILIGGIPTCIFLVIYKKYSFK